MSRIVRVLIADDHRILRAGLEALLDLEPDIEVVGSVGSGEEAIEQTSVLHPDVVVMDLDMPGMGGLAATGKIMKGASQTRVLVLTGYRETQYLMPVLNAGGSGIVNKANAEEELLAAIRIVARGGVFLYPQAARLLLYSYQHSEVSRDRTPLEDLSVREREVMTLVVEGFTSAEIAKKLYLSSKTVDTYRSRLMQKLGIAHRSDLVRLALRTGVLRAGSF